MSGGAEKLLRKAAIEKLASPEQLDMAMRVTSPMGWVALTAIGVAIVADVVWSIVGRIPERVDATGELLRGDRVGAVTAIASGRVKEVLVGLGDVVRKDQLVARLAIPELETQIDKAKADIEDLSARSERPGRRDEPRHRRLRRRSSTRSTRAAATCSTLVAKGLRTQKDLLDIDGQIAEPAGADRAEPERQQPGGPAGRRQAARADAAARRSSRRRATCARRSPAGWCRSRLAPGQPVKAERERAADRGPTRCRCRR